MVHRNDPIYKQLRVRVQSVHYPLIPYVNQNATANKDIFRSLFMDQLCCVLTYNAL